MDMNISKTYSETISRSYQTWKYTTTLTKTVKVESAVDLLKESEKLWKQVKMLTQKDVERDASHRDAIVRSLD